MGLPPHFIQIQERDWRLSTSKTCCIILVAGQIVFVLILHNNQIRSILGGMLPQGQPVSGSRSADDLPRQRSLWVCKRKIMITQAQGKGLRGYNLIDMIRVRLRLEALEECPIEMFEVSDWKACSLYPPRRMCGLRVPSTLVSGYEGKAVRVPDWRGSPHHGCGDLDSPFGIPDSSGL